MASSIRTYGMALAMTLLASCGPSGGEGSAVDGHFEGYKESQLQQFNGGITVPPEYAPTEAVVLSLEAIRTYGMERLFQEILAAGAGKIYLVVPANYNASIATGSDFRALRSRLGTADLAKIQIVRHQRQGVNTVWARDWAPLGGVTDDGRRLLLDFNYRMNQRPTDDNAPSALTAGLSGYERVSIPVYNDGGNFMANDDRHCLMTTRTTDDNGKSFHAADMILGAEQVKAYFKAYAGCADVDIFPRIPYEFTGHIDMWAKFLDNDTVIAGRIEQKAVDLVKGNANKKVQDVQAYLDRRRSELTAMGYEVLAIPMPVPEFGFGGDVFRTYTNSLIVNSTAIIPQYTASSYTDSRFRKEYEDAVAGAYQKAGYTVRFVPSDGIIGHGGSVHCITMQLPKP